MYVILQIFLQIFSGGVFWICTLVHVKALVLRIPKFLTPDHFFEVNID